MASDTLARLIAQHLPDMHRERWAQIDAELATKLASAVGDDRGEVQRQIAAHYANRHRPETSREAIVQQVKTNALKGPDSGR